ncbi:MULTISPECIES: hypothetical protein [unclassified Sphingobacterium]|uniref:hypothetical protein n=1 Tax=unclassified Sphingobacterium TaxID=2609468 RepID=UPI00135890C0|nr:MULTISPECIES: hypothetical protein [unclassified Sphingobacterium]WET70309.1 MAG: hypothetical protein P0Y57_04305 [Sphingobacterium sp.]
MMNIKKNALLLYLSLGAYAGYAQTKWNVKAGVAFSNVDAIRNRLRYFSWLSVLVT